MRRLLALVLASAGAPALAQPPQELTPAERDRIAGQLRTWRMLDGNETVSELFKALGKNPGALKNLERFGQRQAEATPFPGEFGDLLRRDAAPPRTPSLPPGPQSEGPRRDPPNDQRPRQKPQPAPVPEVEAAPFPEIAPPVEAPDAAPPGNPLGRRFSVPLAEERMADRPFADLGRAFRGGPSDPGMTPEDARLKAERFAAALAALEKMSGPLSESEDVRRLLAEFIAGPTPGDPGWGDWLSKLSNGAGRAPDGSLDFGKGLDPKLFEGWEAPKLDFKMDGWNFGGLGNWSLGRPMGFSAPSAPRFGGGGGIGAPSLGIPGAPPASLLLLITVAAAFWLLRGRLGSLGVGLGLFAPPPQEEPALPPIDWENVRSRADLIRAYETATVRRLGPPAKTWHYRRIASSLTAGGVPAAVATPLSDAYALARYSPASDELPERTLADAREQGRGLGGATP